MKQSTIYYAIISLVTCRTLCQAFVVPPRELWKNFPSSAALERRTNLPPNDAPKDRLSSTTLQATGFLPLDLLDSFWRTNPYTAAALTCGIKASAADYVAQKRQMVKDTTRSSTGASPETKKDIRRTVAFAVYGSLYQGIAQEFIYNHLYPVWFGAGSSILEVASKVLADLLIQTTLITLPTAYLIKASVYGYSLKKGLHLYIEDVKNHGLLKKYFALWGPVQCITFGIVPEHWRVTFIAGVSFFWLIILSTIASKPRGSAVRVQTRTENETADDPVMVDQ